MLVKLLGTWTIVVILQTVASTSRVECDLDQAIIDEIQSYQDAVDSIIQYVVYGEHKYKTYNTLQNFVDTFGPRMSGSSALEDSIDWISENAVEEGFDTVYHEAVDIPVWIRNDESATMLTPRVQKLHMLGLGSSIGTPPEGITAEIVAVKTFDELTAIADQAVGKIVVFYQGFESYGQSVQYRSRGAAEAAKVGAVAALVMSATPFSIGSPHTGHQNYEDGVPQIPVAALSVEDAGLLYRLYQSGQSVSVSLKMGATNDVGVSRNTFIETQGYEMPEKSVVIAGHIDSWDVGTGAMDDAGGCFISYHANLVLQKLNLRPRRTLTTLLFTAEEQGIIGGYEFFNKYVNTSARYQLMMESDGGTFSPLGIAFSGTDEATCIMQEIVSLTAAINTTQLKEGADCPDLDVWASVDVPLGSLYLEREEYFWYHHSDGDTLDIEDADELDRNTALWAAVAYVAADISVNLNPNNGN